MSTLQALGWRTTDAGCCNLVKSLRLFDCSVSNPWWVLLWWVLTWWINTKIFTFFVHVRVSIHLTSIPELLALIFQSSNIQASHQPAWPFVTVHGYPSNPTSGRFSFMGNGWPRGQNLLRHPPKWGCSAATVLFQLITSTEPTHLHKQG